MILKTIVLIALIKKLIPFIFFGAIIMWTRNLARRIRKAPLKTLSGIVKDAPGVIKKVPGAISNAGKQIVDKAEDAQVIYETVQGFTSMTEGFEGKKNKSDPKPHIGFGYNSLDYSEKIGKKVQNNIDRLLIKNYGENYSKILKRFDYLLSLKMLDNTLTMDFNDDASMMKNIEKINKYGETRKLIDHMKTVVDAEITPNQGVIQDEYEYEYEDEDEDA